MRLDPIRQGREDVTDHVAGQADRDREMGAVIDGGRRVAGDDPAADPGRGDIGRTWPRLAIQ